MKRQIERGLWIGTTLCLLIITAAVVFAPQVKAQINKQDNEIDSYFTQFETAFYLIKEYYVDEVDSETLFQGAMNGLMGSLDDPYSVFLPVDESLAKSLTDTTSGEFGGVGLYISKDYIEDGNPKGLPDFVRVVSPIEGTPAYKKSIHAEDYIYEIDGKSAEGLSTDQVSGLLRGKPNTDINVTFLRGKDIKINVDITRAIIEIPTVKTAIIDGNLGYIRIIQFTPHTVARVEEALTGFKEKKCAGIIIDVRNNPGGLLSSVVDISDFILSSGTIVSTHSRIKNENKTFTARHKTIVQKKTPIVVLINKGSASASEILAGALKDTDRATLIGSTSYGKGSVQQILRLGNDGLKLTVARYHTPAGTDINKIGIAPDIEVKNEDYSEEEVDSYRMLIEKGLLSQLIKESPKPTEAQIQAFILSLKEDKIDLQEKTVRMLIKRESERSLDNPPVYDMEYDDTLIRAVKELKKS